MVSTANIHSVCGVHYQVCQCDKSYVCRYECFPPLQVSRADHCRDQHNAHSSLLRCCAGSHTEGSPGEKHRKKSFMKRFLIKGHLVTADFTLKQIINLFYYALS